MNRNLIAAGLAGIALTGGLLAFAHVPQGQPPAKEKEGDEVVVKLADAPAPIRAAIAKLTPEKGVKKVTKETDEGVTAFEADYEVDGVACSAKLTERGEVMELEKGVNAGALPEAVSKAIAKKYPKGAVKSAEAVQLFYFEVVMTTDGKTHEVKVFASGEVEDHEEADEEKDEKDEHGKK